MLRRRYGLTKHVGHCQCHSGSDRQDALAGPPPRPAAGGVLMKVGSDRPRGGRFVVGLLLAMIAASRRVDLRDAIT